MGFFIGKLIILGLLLLLIGLSIALFKVKSTSKKIARKKDDWDEF
ncbi:hypothetical protein RV00_GL002038 [Enterococcus devriesei]|uniref:Uncharacterized protein n=1 Tax=Enterococcus devriesei TaxID=319970 RepID=A0A1L8SVM2_9ENTE|nr:hypothetical protein RV00_GL002038 [Enterococcus devriesei]